MTAGELAVLLAAVLCCIGFAALIVVLMRVLDTMRNLQEEVRRLRDETEPLMLELRGSVREARVVVAEARDDLERFDNLIGSAEAISDAVAGGSRVVRGALSAPVIKTVALASGTAKGARRLRRRDRKQMRRKEQSVVMKRATWFAGGVVVGAATTVYAAGKVKRKASQLKPVNVAKSAVVSVRGRFDDLADAVREGRAAMKEKEAELKAVRDGTSETEVYAVEPGRVIVLKQAIARRRP